MWLEVVKASYLEDYKIWVAFNNGIAVVCDMLPVIQKYPAFKPLKDISVFKTFKVTDTIEWINGTIDIAPEYLYEHGIEVKDNCEIFNIVF